MKLNPCNYQVYYIGRLDLLTLLESVPCSYIWPGVSAPSGCMSTLHILHPTPYIIHLTVRGGKGCVCAILDHIYSSHVLGCLLREDTR